MSLADIGSYECIPSNVIGTHNTSMIRVNINGMLKENSHYHNYNCDSTVVTDSNNVSCICVCLQYGS